MTDASARAIAARTGRSEAEARALLAAENPGGRLVTPAEVAEAVLALLTGGSNGAVVELDGGPVGYPPRANAMDEPATNGPRPITVPGWKAPKGYANAVVAAPGARMLSIAGQVAWDAEQRLVGRGDFAAQFRQALANVLEALRAAGGAPEHLMQLTVFVTDKRQYLASAKQLGAAWKELCGRRYPAMALVEVAGLLEDGALVEIQGLAALP
jgi:enamine deaminase RidA (YjgF/YER057c/UK114 family)